MKLKQLYELGKTHIVDSTAGLAVTNPIFTVVENAVYGMTDEVSLNARLFATGITYLGLGSAVSRGRDLSRRIFKIKDTASEKIQWLHDTLYMMGFNAVVAPIMYNVAGEGDSRKILYATLTAVGLSVVNGGLIGYAIDTARDLTGIKKSKRIPKKISNLPSKLKKGLAVASLAALVALNGAIYKLTPDTNQVTPQKDNTSIESIVNQNPTQPIENIINQEVCIK